MGGTTPIPWLQPFYCHFVYVFGDGADLLPPMLCAANDPCAQSSRAPTLTHAPMWPIRFPHSHRIANLSKSGAEKLLDQV